MNDTDPSRSSLSTRGAELASASNIRDIADKLFAEPWDPETNPDGVVNLGTAENLLVLDDVAEFVEGKDLAFCGRDFDYGEGPWGSLRLRTAMARFLDANFNPHVPTDPDHITITNGCAALFNALGLIIADPGDGLLLSMPSYVAFPSDFGLLANMKAIPVPFDGIDQFAPDAIPYYEAALKKAEEATIRIKALVLCNPHNPLGRCYPRATLIALLRFCNKHSIHLIADEIYAMSVYASSPSEPAAVPFTSVLSLDYKQYIDQNYLHVAYGMSKDFACGGLRIGCLYTRNAALQRAVSAVSNFHYSARQRLSRANALAKSLLDELGIKYAPGANAGFFLWVDLRPWLREGDGRDGWEREEMLARRMMSEKVFLTNGRLQSAEEPGWFRFIFSRKEGVLREGIKRLMRALSNS